MTEPGNFNLNLSNFTRHLRASRTFTVGDVLTKGASAWGDRVAVKGGTKGTTYRELNRRVNRLSNALRNRGLGYASRVVLLSENRPEYLEVFYAGAKLGMLVGGLNWRLEREEIKHCVELLEPDLIVGSERHEETRSWLQSSVRPSAEFISFDSEQKNLSYETLLSSASTDEPQPESPVSPEDGLSVLFTSGTTGTPKAAVISHRAFLARAAVKFQLGFLSAEDPDFIGWTPLFHMGALDPVVAAGLGGGTYYAVDGFRPDVLVDCLTESRTRFLPLVPATVEPFLEHLDRENRSADDFPVLRYVGVMADLVPPEQIKRLTSRLEARYVNSFGTTETGYPPGTGNFIPEGIAPDSSLLSKRESSFCRIKLVDDSGDPVDAGEVGELLVKGPTLFSGYLSDPEATRDSFEEGWYCSGDLFARNPDGTLDFVDRKKYLIKSGGENIYPAELEQHLVRHPAVEECVVIRVPDETWGEVPKAYLKLKPDRELSPADVTALLEGKVARYKLPHYVEFVRDRSFPRNSSGKIQRGEVESWAPENQHRVRSPSR